MTFSSSAFGMSAGMPGFNVDFASYTNYEPTVQTKLRKPFHTCSQRRMPQITIKWLLNGNTHYQLGDGGGNVVDDPLTDDRTLTGVTTNPVYIHD